MAKKKAKEEEVVGSSDQNQAIVQAITFTLPASLVPILVRAGKVAGCILVDELATGIKTVDLGPASPIVNMLVGNVATMAKDWINSLGNTVPTPGPTPVPPAPYYPPEPGPNPAPTPNPPYVPPQPAPTPAPAPTPGSPEINAK